MVDESWEVVRLNVAEMRNPGEVENLKTELVVGMR